MWKRSTNSILHLTFTLIKQKRNYCDIKTNVELLLTNSEKPTIPSNFQIKKSIKNLQNYELTDGFSCIRTKCPICIAPPTSKVNDRNDIYVNKTSGI